MTDKYKCHIYGNKYSNFCYISVLFQDIFQSDWYAMQLNTVMQEMFRDIDGVIYLDVWQMTSCHYLHENVHQCTCYIVRRMASTLILVCFFLIPRSLQSLRSRLYPDQMVDQHREMNSTVLNVSGDQDN